MRSRRMLVAAAAALASAACVTAALWVAGQSGVWSQEARRPDDGQRALLLVALAVAAAGQGVLAFVAVPAAFRKGRFETILGVLAITLSVAAAGGAAWFAWRGL